MSNTKAVPAVSVVQVVSGRRLLQLQRSPLLDDPRSLEEVLRVIAVY